MAQVNIPSGTHVSEIESSDCQFAVMVGYSGQSEFVVKKRYFGESNWHITDEFEDYNSAHSAMLEAYNVANGHPKPAVSVA